MTYGDSLHAEAAVLLHTVQCAVHTGEERAPATDIILIDYRITQ